MSDGPRTLDSDERRVIAMALRTAAGEVRVIKASWDKGGNISSALARNLAGGEAQTYVDHLNRFIGTQERLAADVENTEYEIKIVRRKR